MYKYIKLLQLHENQEMPLSNHMRIAKKTAFFVVVTNAKPVVSNAI